MKSEPNRIIVALDVPDRASALKLIERLDGVVKTFKVGNQLFTAEGPDLVREIVAAGFDVFLDLKYHDIPNTVASAVSSASRLGVSILNVHVSGGAEMMRAAIAAASRFGSVPRAISRAGGARRGNAPDITRGDQTERPAIIGVTVLTSLDDRSLAEIGIARDAVAHSVMLAQAADQAGLDGVVASPQEVAPIREHVQRHDFIIITPGVRPAGSEAGDQKRVGTPAQALRDGADYLVIGRPITANSDPRAAAERILEQIQ